MRLRPYIASRDYEYLQKWVNDERTHALWCANMIPYPMTYEKFQEVLEKDSYDWRGCAFVATEDNGKQCGFFVLAINELKDMGFLKFVIVDNELRGKGYGKEMITLILKYAFEIAGVSLIQLNVFDINESARRCYSSVGFMEDSIAEKAFIYKDESWGRCHMTIAKC